MAGVDDEAWGYPVAPHQLLVANPGAVIEFSLPGYDLSGAEVSVGEDEGHAWPIEAPSNNQGAFISRKLGFSDFHLARGSSRRPLQASRRVGPYTSCQRSTMTTGEWHAA
jgi:hypothetical protein